jgi:hypothetical protein
MAMSVTGYGQRWITSPSRLTMYRCVSCVRNNSTVGIRPCESRPSAPHSQRHESFKPCRKTCASVSTEPPPGRRDGTCVCAALARNLLRDGHVCESDDSQRLSRRIPAGARVTRSGRGPGALPLDGAGCPPQFRIRRPRRSSAGQGPGPTVNRPTVETGGWLPRSVRAGTREVQRQ